MDETKVVKVEMIGLTRRLKTLKYIGELNEQKAKEVGDEDGEKRKAKPRKAIEYINRLRESKF